MITLRNYQDKKIGVFGLGKAGTATIASLVASGADVFVWDDKEENRKSFSQMLASGRAGVVEPNSWNWAELDALILSPGVPLTHPKPHYIVDMANQAGVKIIGDIELLYEAQPNVPKIAITGTNGKSTTTALIAHILRFCQRNVEMGGNFGIPALDLNPITSDGCYVLELSSYQLDIIKNAHFNIALLLNVTKDHLDRHGSIQRYVEAKSNIFNHQNKYDFAIVSLDDDYSRSVYSELKLNSKAGIVAISTQNVLKKGVFVDKNGVLHDKIDPDAPLTIKLYDIINLTGKHNWQNAAFAYTACRLYGILPRDIDKALRTFPGLRHRLQIVATVHGVRFINDSKATNADSTSYALAPFSNIYWIAGGKAKEGGIETLSRFFGAVHHAFLIGESEEEFSKVLDGRVAYTKCGNLENAFNEAAKMALAERRQNAVVMLSPACASFDQWKNFEERGDAFCKMVDNLLDKVVMKK